VLRILQETFDLRLVGDADPVEDLQHALAGV
jgi:hypothetical protein